ncbi:MAG: hypothetical protein WBG09_16325 [Candidatus Sulfotelmatobacter sp.]|jgi:hypothetical protein
MLNTAIVTNQPTFPMNFPTEKKPYRTDPFTLIDGRFVGHDGFVVPKDFDEFHQRFPHHIPNWVKRHTDRLALREDLEDWTQDLIIHLKYLPLKSKHREAGKEDIVQTFDPGKHHGANQARFLNYINVCLANKFRTIHSKRRKDAMCHTGNLSLTGQVDAKNCGEVDDEYCHEHSEYLRRTADISEKRARDRTFVREFVDFVRRKDLSVLPAIQSILATGTPDDAAEFLGITDARFSRLRTRIRQLGKCFMTGDDHIPKQRRPYKKRAKAIATPSLVAA